MSSRLHECSKKKLLSPDNFVLDNLCYEALVGSHAYGTSTDSSDWDIQGITVPPKSVIFPHLAGHIPNLGPAPKGFDQYIQHHVMDREREYDFTIFSIVKFFHLALNNNPNILDILYVPQRCILYMNQVGEMIRSNRKIFLSRKLYHSFSGYAASQLHKMIVKKPQEGSERWRDVMLHDYDTKFGCHLVRLMLEARQLLSEGTMDLEANSEILKAIRKGEWSYIRLADFFEIEERALHEIEAKSELPYSPDLEKIRQLFMECVSVYYGDLKVDMKTALATEGSLLEEMKVLVSKYEH